MGIEATSSIIGGGDYRWLKSEQHTDYPESGTLNVSTFTPVNGVIPSGTPVQLNAGLYELGDAVDTAGTLAGFVWHDIAAVAGGANQPAGILRSATIIAANVPGSHDLVDGNYVGNAVEVGA